METDEQQPLVHPASNLEPDDKKNDDTGPPPRKPGTKGQGRKRTKTGCLTCRQRRIKCGEEKPTCQNCIKSKRHCDGYNQRVVFKEPVNAYQPSLSTPAQRSLTTPILGQPSARRGSQDQRKESGSKPTAIAPKTSSAFGTSIRDTDAAPMSILPPASPSSERRYYSFPDSGRRGSNNSQSPSRKDQPQVVVGPDVIDQPRLPEPRRSRPPLEQASHYDFSALTKTESREQAPHTSTRISQSERSAGLSPTVPFYPTYPNTTWMPRNSSFPTENTFIPRRHPSETGRILETPEERQTGQTSDQYGSQPNLTACNPFVNDFDDGLPRPFAGQQIPPEEEMEDPFDVSGDDIAMGEAQETEVWQDDAQDIHLKSNDLGIIVALQASQDSQGLGLRSYNSFIDRPDMLATYMPSSQATPMRDPMTALIFCHFVNVTGPSMSIFERHPANPSLMFQGAPVPRSQQHIWAYTFPTLALQNPGLLHAMLSLASLHIAKLQDGPITASLKHYAIGIRRVAKSVSLPSRRGQPATLAAALLLAFYECWSADHQKWSNHLLGAKQLVREIDFKGMTKFIKKKRTQQRHDEQMRQHQAQLDGWHPSFDGFNPFSSAIDDVDENLVSMLMGKKVRYDEYGQVMPDFVSEPDWCKEYTERELEIYETQRDLFWWYCKQDVYQSILGAGKLFMDYAFWSHCPPRAPIGRLNAVYGTFDHLILLMGRLADFAARDMKRKRAMIQANGGWRPDPAHGSGSSSQAGAPPSSPQTPTMMPSFSGMVPGVKEAQLPMGFEASRDTSPQSVQSDEVDLQTRTAEAEEEWQEIRAAFTVLEDHFGEDFQALGPEFSAPVETPFGTALQYRTYGIAGIWMNYYMGLIYCYRSHPSMPPATMVAAGIMRRQTEYYANQLGRIAAGIAPECYMSPGVNTSVGSALIESSTCIFIAAIQYQDPAQRTWTIRRLRHIARLTGWQTALAIASGCEASWVKTYEIGKGPFYERSPDDASIPASYPSSRRIDRAFIGKSSEERKTELERLERPDRVHYALGVLGLEEDLQGLDISGGTGS